VNRLNDERLMTIGRWFFGIALVAWGIQHLVAGDFVTRVVPHPIGQSPSRWAWAYLVGGFLIVAGMAILLSIRARIAAWAFALFAFLSFLFLHLPGACRGMLWGGAWTSAGKALVMSGGALCVALSLIETGKTGTGRLLARPAVRTGLFIWSRICLGLFMILAGIQHFLFPQFVAGLIPVWIPGAMFWTYFAGVALIAGGVGIIAPWLTRRAALLSGMMIFAWVFLVHLPLVWANPHDQGNIAAVFEALAFAGVAFMIAGLARLRRLPR
jgi:uncharacterized membrane protein YphA (DoxX/SURF4 family)